MAEFHPYYPAQLVPLGAVIKTHDASRLEVQYVVQDGLKVKIACLWSGQIIEKRYTYDQCVYIDTQA